MSTLSFEEYVRLARVNFSTLKLIARSPLHYAHALEHGTADSEVLKRGRLGHLAVLQPDELDRVAVWTGARRQGRAWDAFQDENVGREIVTAAQMAQARAIARAVRASSDAQRYFAAGRPEVTVLWNETVVDDEFNATEIECKGRVDFVSDASAIVDLKIVKDASPAGFGRAVWSYGWHTQAAWYVDGFVAAVGERRPFAFVAVEAAPPYAVAVYRVPDAVLEAGREEYRGLLATLAECRRTNRWPGYGEETELELPRWAGHFHTDEALEGLDLDFGGESEAA